MKKPDVLQNYKSESLASKVVYRPNQRDSDITDVWSIFPDGSYGIRSAHTNNITNQPLEIAFQIKAQYVPEDVKNELDLSIT